MLRPNKKRIFIALNLPEEIKKEIANLTNKLKPVARGVKWVNSEGLHITLHFLGDLTEEQISKIKEIMQSLSGKFREMQFSLKRIGAFPNLNRPRVIFLQSEQTNGSSVFKLQEMLGKELAKIGLDIDKRPWQPHITLGRAKINYKLPRPRHAQRGRQIINYEFNNLNFVINSFELMQSELQPEGPKYTEIASFGL